MAGTELAALTDVFLAESQAPKLELQHHEQNKSFMNQFHVDFKKMVTKFEEMVNLFFENSYTLFAMDTEYVIEGTVVEALATAHSPRKEQFKAFYELHICIESNKLITDTIPKNKLKTFTKDGYKTKSKDKSTIDKLKTASKLFAEMYISTQTRDGDM